MAFPTLLDIILAVVVLVVGVPIVYLLSKALKLRPKPITIAHPRREATLVFLVLAGVSIAIVFWQAIFIPTLQLERRPSSFDVIHVPRVALHEGLLLLPMFIVMKRTGQTLGSIGINRKDTVRMLLLGLILSAIYITVYSFVAPFLGGDFTGFSTSLAYGFIVYAFVGFGEEIVFRGYIQTRLIAYSDTLKGLVATSLLFALIHFPSQYYLCSGVVLEALAQALMRFPPGLLLGYIMFKSQNIIPSSIFHLFYNWNTLLWQSSS